MFELVGCRPAGWGVVGTGVNTGTQAARVYVIPNTAVALPWGNDQGSHIVADPLYAPSGGYNKNLLLHALLPLWVPEGSSQGGV